MFTNNRINLKNILFALLTFMICLTYNSCDFGLVQKLSEDDFKKKYFEENGYYPISYGKAIINSNSNIYMTDLNDLIRIDMSDRSYEVLKKFDKEIKALDIQDDIVYLSEGSNIWKYDSINSNFGLIHIAASTVFNIYLLENYMVINDLSGAWSTNTLLRLRDNIATDSVEWQESSRSYVYHEGMQRIFTFRDGTSPNDICYIDLDIANEVFLRDGDSPYHGDYSFGHPIKISSDGSKLFTGSGNVFNSSDMTYSESILEYIDLVTYGDFILIINKSNQILKINDDSGYSYDSKLKDYSNNPVQLLLMDGKLYVVIQYSDSSIGIDVISLNV